MFCQSRLDLLLHLRLHSMRLLSVFFDLTLSFFKTPVKLSFCLCCGFACSFLHSKHDGFEHFVSRLFH